MNKVSEHKDVSIDEAIQLMENDEVEILDVRTLEEYEAGHLKKAKLFPIQEIEKWIRQLDPNKKYLVVCRAAHRSLVASEFLSLSGYKHVYNMLGGMIEWTGAIEK